MYCPQCGAQNEDNAYRCLQCGFELHKPMQAQYSSNAPYIPNYLVQSILVTIFCCLPFGIPAIVYASQVNGKLLAGDISGAQDSSDKARMWCWIALIVGLISCTVYGAISLLPAVLAAV